ncbi:hypothetical protein D9M71_831920 [compost metagenome]
MQHAAAADFPQLRLDLDRHSLAAGCQHALCRLHRPGQPTGNDTVEANIVTRKERPGGVRLGTAALRKGNRLRQHRDAVPVDIVNRAMTHEDDAAALRIGFVHDISLSEGELRAPYCAP